MSSAASSLARGDIIDLDRYMRNSVRPASARHAGDRLVVDAGGVGGVGGVGVGSSTDSARGARRDKRYWDDSGLSDGSCAKQRGKPHRRVREGGGGSVREFRAACERALRDQQLQLARVTQLCELLLQAPPHSPGADHASCQLPDQSAQVAKRNFGQNVSPCSAPRRRAFSRSSDASSSGSSRSRRAHRSESCQTYDIIVSKLDELNRLFAARRAAPPAAPPATPSATPPTAPPAASPAAPPAASPAAPRAVLVATEEPAPAVQAMHERRVGARCAVARVHELDIAPRGAGGCGDADSAGRWSAAELHEEDPVRAMHAGTQRARMPDKRRGGSLCALCRGSWRTLRRRLAHQLFGA